MDGNFEWGSIQQRFQAYWSRENHDRPLIAITAPRAGYVRPPVSVPQSLAERWLDVESVIQQSRAHLAGTFYAGEAFPCVNPNLGPDLFGALVGCNLQFGENTSWSDHPLTTLEGLPRLQFDPQNRWWQKIRELTEALVQDARGDYLVGMTDLHTGLDALVSLRGPENLCLDLLDSPETVKKATFELLDVFKTVIDELSAITAKNQTGTTNWMGIWHPGKWYVTSCDLICMISPQMFAEFVLPELAAEIDWLDASVFHLDGPGALRHLDALLEIPKLKGIQWVYGAGQPTAACWLPVLKKIQKAGKLIQVSIVAEDLDVLLAELQPKGVLYTMHVQSEQEARDIYRKVENFRKRLYY